MGYCGPQPYASSAGLLFWGLLSIMAQGIAACFGGVFSFAFFVLTEVGVGISFTLGGIGHGALATIKLVEASIVFSHVVSSLVSGAMDVVAVVALGCCAIGELLVLRVNRLSSSWNFLVGLGIS